MKIPFLIFFISGLATLQFEPLASRGAELASRFVRYELSIHASPADDVESRDQTIDCLSEQLAEVQMDMMKVLEADPAEMNALQTREANLKYALRAAQVRRDEMAQCLRAGKRGPSLAQLAARCLVSEAGKPQS
jgi:hypothetical protein